MDVNIVSFTPYMYKIIQVGTNKCIMQCQHCFECSLYPKPELKGIFSSTWKQVHEIGTMPVVISQKLG